jgi:cellulose synthase/poly-beta-1,6-N-acetylglucosamine synthase-like glycosyltransferase
VFSDVLPLWATLVLALHFFILAVLCLFGLHRLSMVLRWFLHRHDEPQIGQTFDTLPLLTVQIPLYNERLVAQRIVDAVAAFDYPSDRLQIQVVDDSTDQTLDIIAATVQHYQAKGLNISHVTRNNRVGYKAGALKQAMEFASGEFIAIFDADFMPHPSLLRDTIDHFCRPEVGMVQYRWEHLNRFSSKLTETQAMVLDAHFGLEQKVRCNSQVLLNFNGTAGMWRTAAILDAGHWSADTLTEDLDLSYRAQMRGWKMQYLNTVSCEGELPADMNAFKSQQHRWVKGGVQVMKKLLPSVWRSSISIKAKIEASYHLCNNLAYLIMLLHTIFLLLPSILIRDYFGIEYLLWIDLPLLLLSSGGHLVYLVFGQVALQRSFKTALINLPRLMLLGIQLAFNNARAATEALLGQESEFVRTPKSGELATASLSSPQVSQPLYQAVAPKGAIIELLLALIYSLVFIWSVYAQMWFVSPFLLLLTVGFVDAAIRSLSGQLRLKSCA